MGRQANGQMDEWTNGRTDERTNERTDKWTDGGADGGVHGLTDGRAGGHFVFPLGASGAYISVTINYSSLKFTSYGHSNCYHPVKRTDP